MSAVSHFKVQLWFLTSLSITFTADGKRRTAADDRFHGNVPYGEILTKKEPIRTLGFTLPYNNVS